MSSVQSKSLSLEASTIGNYATAGGLMQFNRKDTTYSGNHPMTVITSSSATSGTATFGSNAMTELFPNATVKPIKADIAFNGTRWIASLFSSPTAYFTVTWNGTQLFQDSVKNNSRTDFTHSNLTSTAITNCQKGNTSFVFTLNCGTKNVYIYVFSGTITLYFTRYDFSATAGSNVSSTSVSSSTGYDGDTITYSCVLASGATFDGWYNGSTRVSTSQSYTHTVNGADMALEARATLATPGKSFSALYGNSIVISQNQNSSVSIVYNSGTIASLTDSDRIKNLLCKDKYMATAVTAGGKTLNCGGKLLSYNIPMLYCYGSWELNKGLVVGTATLADASGWATTPFIPVGGKINVTIETGGTRSGASMLNEYNSSFGYASYWGHGDNPRTFTFDTAASYIRCTFLMSDLSNCYIKDNTNNKYLFKGGNV